MTELSATFLGRISFVKELDRLKTILRQSLILDSSRRENTAEHSWHLATAVVVLADHANGQLRLERAIRMALLHDVVEIYAGDTPIYDLQANKDKEVREREAMTKLIQSLPAEQGRDIEATWLEYEEGCTLEARFVLAVDRLLPLIANMSTGGHSWKKYSVKKAQVFEIIKGIESGSKEIYQYLLGLIEEACQKGYLLP